MSWVRVHPPEQNRKPLMEKLQEVNTFPSLFGQSPLQIFPLRHERTEKLLHLKKKKWCLASGKRTDSTLGDLDEGKSLENPSEALW